MTSLDDLFFIQRMPEYFVFAFDNSFLESNPIAYCFSKIPLDLLLVFISWICPAIIGIAINCWVESKAEFVASNSISGTTPLFVANLLFFYYNKWPPLNFQDLTNNYTLLNFHTVFE